MTQTNLFAQDPPRLNPDAAPATQNERPRPTERQRPTNRAEAQLWDWGLSAAWDVYQLDYDQHAREWGYEEPRIRDIVAKLVRYGSISEPTQRYLRGLVENLSTRAARLAAIQDVPTGRYPVTGKVLTIRVDDTRYGPATKMLVETNSGFKLWMTRPNGLSCIKGDTIRFTATLKPSPSDPKFGFASRPTNAAIIKGGLEGV